MYGILRIFVAITLFMCAGLAIARPPDEHDIERLLEQSKFQQTFESLPGIFEVELHREIARYTNSEALSPEQRQWVDNVVAAMQRELSWELLRPVAIEAYRHAYNKRDIEYMIRFHETPQAQRISAVMPLIFHELIRGEQDNETIREQHIDDQDWAYFMAYRNRMTRGRMLEKTMRFNAIFGGAVNRIIEDIEYRYGDLIGELRMRHPDVVTDDSQR